MHEESGSLAVRAVRGSAIRDLLSVVDRPEVLSLAGGLPAPDLLPTERVARAAQTALTSPSALQYGVTTGAPALRDVVHARESAKLGRDAGAVRHFQLAQGSTDAPVLCVEAINKEFPLAGDMHFKG